MFRHPHYLEVPWDMQRHPVAAGPHRHLWWLIALLVLFAMFLIGVGITSGLIYPALFMAVRGEIAEPHRETGAEPSPQTGTGAKKKGASPQQYGEG